MSALNKAGSAVRYASRTTGVDFEKWLTWGAIGGIAYLLIKGFQFGAAVKSGLNSAGEAIGSGLFEFVHGNDVKNALAPNLIVYFPNEGKMHQVPQVKLDNNAGFVNANLAPQYAGDGKAYQIVKAKTPISLNGVTTSWVAVPQ